MAENDLAANTQNQNDTTALTAIGAVEPVADTAADVAVVSAPAAERGTDLAPIVDPAQLEVPFNTDAMGLIEAAKTKVLDEIDASISWYAEKAPQRGATARRLRIAMITTGGLSAVIPSLTQMHLPAWMVPVLGETISPMWTSVLIALTATLYAYERFYGDAEAWMRFVLAQQQLQRLREEFELNWLTIQVLHVGQPDLGKEMAELIRVSRARHRIIQIETEQWTAAFKAGLQATTPKQVEEKGAATGS
ncbi:SLATT domain-containing protein [Undibacterium rugosum]|uniref:SLATT domain-containing protein n=1 Tax=Undibacterium rugosum TaxID=2762291 RepID=UPI001B833B69|nr:DUF4231 domain-containing protein [Undibacterium rugosum]MBR7777315.1 DUF4231 domain-containing protein [Undibacterium rugosum]